MKLSISKTEKSKGGRPKTGATPVLVRLQPDDLAALDALIASRHDPKPSRPEAIRSALREWLSGTGLLKATGSDLDMTIEKLDQEHAAMGAKPSPKKALNRMRAAIAKNKKGKPSVEPPIAISVEDLNSSNDE